MNVCLECGRDARPHHYSALDKPGTVALYGRGLCRPCWARMDRAGTLDKLYPVVKDDGRTIRAAVVPRDKTVPCEQCGKAMRPPGSRLEDWPGTLQRKGRTCSSCAALRQKGRQFISTPDVQKMRDDLKDWFYSRGRDWTKAGIPA